MFKGGLSVVLFSEIWQPYLSVVNVKSLTFRYYYEHTLDSIVRLYFIIISLM